MTLPDKTRREAIRQSAIKMVGTILDVEELLALLNAADRLEEIMLHGSRGWRRESSPLLDARPCPFCDGTPYMASCLRGMAEDGEPDARAYYMTCQSCACEGPWAKSATGAERNWDRFGRTEFQQNLLDAAELRANAMERERDEALAKLDEVEAQAASMWEILDILRPGTDPWPGAKIDAALSGSAGRALLARVARMDTALRKRAAVLRQAIAGRTFTGLHTWDLTGELAPIEEALR